MGHFWKAENCELFGVVFGDKKNANLKIRFEQFCPDEFLLWKTGLKIETRKF
jgi:hypothetical protein